MAPGHFAPKIVKVRKEYTFNVSESGSAKSGERISATVTIEGDGAHEFSVTLTPAEFGTMRGEIIDQGWTRVPTGNPR